MAQQNIPGKEDRLTPTFSGDTSIAVEEDVDSRGVSDYYDFRKCRKIFDNARFWSMNLGGTLIPFVLLGLPIETFFPKSGHQEIPTNEKVYPWSFMKLFRYRFQSKRAGLISIVLFPVYLIATGYWWYTFGRVALYSWIWRGILSLGDIYDVLHLLTIAPFCILVNYIWLCPHAIEPLIRSILKPISLPESNGSSSPRSSPEIASGINNNDDLDDVSGESSTVQDELRACLEENSKLQVNIITIKTEVELHNWRRYLQRTYVIWILLHIMHVFIMLHRFKVEKWPRDEKLKHWANYGCIVSYTFMFPVYSTFCGVIMWKFHGLNEFIRKTVDSGEKMKMRHVFFIKRTYTTIADDITHVNFLCRRFFIFILVIVFYNMSSNTLEFAWFFICRFLGMLFAYFEWLGSLWPRTSIIASDDVFIPHDVIRVFAGMLIETLVYVYLLLTFLYDAVHVNDEARYLHVRLNNMAADLAAGCHYEDHVPIEFKSSSGSYGKAFWFKQNFINEDVYRAFVLLKQYVHSRMEAHAGKHQALLNIFGLSYFRPAITDRVSGYRQIN